jgi:hypothetical protein
MGTGIFLEGRKRLPSSYRLGSVGFRCGRCPLWQSPQATVWILCLLADEWKVVSIFRTSMPQWELPGWHAPHDTWAETECDW